MAADEDDGPTQDRPMTLFEHLEELRKRLFRAVLYLGVAFALAWFWRAEIWSVVAVPIHEILLKAGGRLQVTELSESFYATFKLCLVVAIVAASPGILWEIWGFVSRGLHPHERKPVRIYVPIAAFLFMEGVLFYYFLVQPATLEWLLIEVLPSIPLIGGGIIPVDKAIKLTDAVGFFLGMSLVIGLVFELPLVMIFLQKVGITSWRSYSKYRRHFLMGAMVITAILTPSGDMFTLGLCMIPIVFLYEGGILVCRLMMPPGSENDPGAEEDERTPGR